MSLVAIASEIIIIFDRHSLWTRLVLEQVLPPAGRWHLGNPQPAQ